MNVVSRTAVWVAAGRAIGAREPDVDVRNPDYLAERFLGDVSQYDVASPVVDGLAEDYDEAMEDFEVASFVRTMLVRTRFIDEALEQAIDDGAEQVLILGAGFDSHAYRFEDLLHGVRVFEVDRPLMADFKRRRVIEVLGAEPANVTYLAVDFETDDLQAKLRESGYDFSLRTFVIMEGLTMYLTEAVLRDTFALVASHAAGSRVVFDFVTNVMIAMIRNIDIDQVPAIARGFLQRFLDMVRDEPFQYGFPLGQEREAIESFGFEVADLILLDGDEAVRRYLTRADGSELAAGTMARRPVVPGAEAQRESMSYRICEAVVAARH